MKTIALAAPGQDYTTERQFRLPLRRSDDAIGTASFFVLLYRSCARVNFYLEFIAPEKKRREQKGHSEKSKENER